MLKNIVISIFRFHGYIVSGDKILYGKKNGNEIVIGYKDGRIDEVDLSEILASKIDTKIFVSMERIDERIKEIAKEKKIILWDREMLKREIGEMLLQHPECFTLMNEPKTERITERIIKPQIKKHELKEITTRIGQPIISLELVPYYVYFYECELLVDGSLSTHATTGLIGVNGLNKTIEDIDMDVELCDDIEHPYAKIEPIITPQKAFVIAKEKAIERNTKTVEMKKDKDVAIVYERREIKPREDVIKLDYRGVFYVPVWNAKSKTGMMKISAITGKVIEEEIYKSPVFVDEKIDVI